MKLLLTSYWAIFSENSVSESNEHLIKMDLTNTIRKTSQILLLLITTLMFVFALLSGSEGYGGGFMGIIKNSPNTFPWALLFGLNYLVWKKE